MYNVHILCLHNDYHVLYSTATAIQHNQEECVAGLCRAIWEGSAEITCQHNILQVLAQSDPIMKPMSDLCLCCQRNTNFILLSINQPEEVKSTAIKEAEEHIRVVGIETSYYTKLRVTIARNPLPNTWPVLALQHFQVDLLYHVPTPSHHTTVLTWHNRFIIPVIHCNQALCIS